ncbi:NADPH-dependent glutamate synthase [Tenuifilum thalassicum]|uniref:NADPH-dependent glutamate synthase n=2 Tax=Tenuifilum thalassicum TaxID=2590900 RepID=A0A7D3Y1H1_9BACT|nr:NADPH-dependent glutamate synthase [Tenuifilum thalassicum]
MGTLKSRVAIAEQSPKERRSNFNEVCLGYNIDEARLEATRCLECKKPKCVEACPVSINIPLFIKHIKSGDIAEAAKVIDLDSSLPAVCGRVCPQEIQCEGSCVMGKKGEPVSIGKLERFVADWTIKNHLELTTKSSKRNSRVAVIGSGPAGLSCASDLAKMGYEVTVFEALHMPGGVLVYGIPEFRLPKSIVEEQINQLKRIGVRFELDVIVGKTITVDSLMEEEGYGAVFISTGAGLPRFMGIPGENLNGVVSANEFLTRINLMKAYQGDYDTPVYIGKNVVVVGGGNVAMDAARSAIRLGSNVKIVYRRSEKELPARAEEVHHAIEEGVEFCFLTNPVEILSDEKGWVNELRCVKMRLGEPDSNGRRVPEPIPNSAFSISCDMVIMALGTSPNPLIINTTKGLKSERWGGIHVVNEFGKTTRPGVFAGGDAVTGAATVILAMQAGRKAAAAIDEFLRERDSKHFNFSSAN